MSATGLFPGVRTFRACGLTNPGTRRTVPVLINELRVLSVLE